MVVRKITLKPKTSNKKYTQLCNLFEKQGIFLSCGNTDDKWIAVKFEDERDCLAWMIANGIATVMGEV